MTNSNENTKIIVPTWFLIVVGIALLWNLMGVAAYLGDVLASPENRAALPEDQRLVYENRPMWALVAFTFAVFGGALGCIGLLLRKAWAQTLLLLSLAGIIVQMAYNLFVLNAVEVYGPGSMIMPVMVLVIGIALVWLGRKAIGHGWIS